jgi:hypothetical protein
MIAENNPYYISVLALRAIRNFGGDNVVCGSEAVRQKAQKPGPLLFPFFRSEFE